MSYKQLTKRLQRELAASPKKAAVLGLLVLVALYFWAPLVWSWMSKDDSAAQVAAAAPAADTAVPTVMPLGPANRETVATAPVSCPWRQVAQGIDGDPRTKTAPQWDGRRDPFTMAERKETVEAKPQGKPAPVKATVTPASLNLALSSTIIGSQRRVAQINGRTYREGQTIKFTAKDGQSFAFTLAEIHPTEVILQRDGERFPLAIRKPASSGQIELFGAAQ